MCAMRADPRFFGFPETPTFIDVPRVKLTRKRISLPHAEGVRRSYVFGSGSGSAGVKPGAWFTWSALAPTGRSSARLQQWWVRFCRDSTSFPRGAGRPNDNDSTGEESLAI